VGCGKGVLLSRIDKELDVDYLAGTDISQKAIQEVNAKRFAGEVGQVPPLYFNDKSFDVVIGSEILEHVDDWQYLLEEMERVGRAVIIAVPDNCLGEIETHRHVLRDGDFPGYTVEKMRERKVPIILAWRKGE